MTHARRATPIPTFCAICRRHAVALGYAPPKQHRAPPIWLCDDEYCHAAAARTYAMPGPMLDAYELAAMLEAGGIAAEYLEQLGITDIAKLNPDTWREFLRRLLTSYEHVLRRKILSDESTF